MNQLILPFSLLLSVFSYVEAQDDSDTASPSQDTGRGNISGIAGVVLGVLFIMIFVIIFLFILWPHGRNGIINIVLSIRRICWHSTSAAHDHQQTPEVLERLTPRSSGIDRIVIESLPFFRFSSLGGLRGGLECAVCLSKFEDVEILRLLPKCKHAFHVNCVDRWLENHSSCPLCRQRISVEDLTYSDSLRFLSSQSEVREDPNVELFVQREDSRRQGSSRFSIGSSFRKSEEVLVKEDELPMIEACEEGLEENDKFLHKFNHKIIMSDSVFRSRWSNLSSSDLLFLSSEMLGDLSSKRFPPSDSSTQENSTTQATKDGGILKITDGMGLNRDSETKIGKLNQNESYPLSSGSNTLNPTRNLHPNEKRSMSEIVVHSRFKEWGTRNNSVRESSVPENAAKEERLKMLWLPIARKTVQWYAHRDKKYRPSSNTRQSSNV